MTLHVTPQERRTHARVLRDYKDLLPKRLGYAKRQRIEDAIEAFLSEADRLILLLDMFEGDADIEGPDCDLEPTTGCETYVPGLGYVDDIDIAWTENPGKGGQIPHHNEDAEPSLAHTNDMNQTSAMRADAGWSSGSDLEWEHDGREPDDESNIVAVDGKQGLLGSEDGNLSVRQWRSLTSGRL
jgi:hypothetical protein